MHFFVTLTTEGKKTRGKDLKNWRMEEMIKLVQQHLQLACLAPSGPTVEFGRSDRDHGIVGVGKELMAWWF